MIEKTTALPIWKIGFFLPFTAKGGWGEHCPRGTSFPSPCWAAVHVDVSDVNLGRVQSFKDGGWYPPPVMAFFWRHEKHQGRDMVDFVLIRNLMWLVCIVYRTTFQPSWTTKFPCASVSFSPIHSGQALLLRSSSRLGRFHGCKSVMENSRVFDTFFFLQFPIYALLLCSCVVVWIQDSIPSFSERGVLKFRYQCQLRF